MNAGARQHKRTGFPFDEQERRCGFGFTAVTVVWVNRVGVKSQKHREKIIPEIAKQQVLENSNGGSNSNDIRNRTRATYKKPTATKWHARHWAQPAWILAPTGRAPCRPGIRRLGIPHRQQGSPLQRDLGRWALVCCGSSASSLPLYPFPFRALATGRVTSASAGTVAVDSVLRTPTLEHDLNHDPQIVASTG